MNKNKYIIYFLMKEEGIPTFLKKVKGFPSMTTVRFKKGATYEIDMTHPSFRKGLKRFYFIDINSSQIHFGEGHETPKEVLDLILRQGIIERMFSGISNKLFGSFNIAYIFCLVIGGLIGYMIGGM